MNMWKEVVRNNRNNQNQANYELAAFYSFLGEKEQAYNILRHMEHNFPGNFVRFINHDPRFKLLWKEEEFRNIVERQENELKKIRQRLYEINEKSR